MVSAADQAPPGTVAEFVVETLRDQIVLGELKPGAKLSVYTLADQLGISRVPVREAVRQLEAEALVENLPRRGTIIRPLSLADITDAYEIFERIEVLAASRAAGDTEGEVAKEMRYWLDRMESLRKDGAGDRSREFLHAHRAFHFAMFGAGGSGGVLDQHLRMLWNTTERYVINGRTEERLDQSAVEHGAIVDAIAASDLPRVQKALAHHLKASRAATLKCLAAH